MKSTLSYPPTIDIVIPAYNEAKSISECISILKEQTYLQSKLSVYVAIDPKTTDGTAPLAKQAGAIVATCDSPGIGQLAWQAALGRDLPLLVNMTLLVTLVTLGANSVSDLTSKAFARRAA